MGWMAPLRHLGAKMPVGRKPPANREPYEITTIGLDLAKHVFQVHGVDAEGKTVLRKQLRRAQVLAFFSRLPRCLVGMEACATGLLEGWHAAPRRKQQTLTPPGSLVCSSGVLRLGHVQSEVAPMFSFSEGSPQTASNKSVALPGACPRQH